MSSRLSRFPRGTGEGHAWLAGAWLWEKGRFKRSSLARLSSALRSVRAKISVQARQVNMQKLLP